MPLLSSLHHRVYESFCGASHLRGLAHGSGKGQLVEGALWPRARLGLLAWPL